MELYQANNQWATRPADERFWTLEDMYTASAAHHKSARESEVRVRQLAIKATPTGDLALVGPAGNPATLTNWAFGQLANRVSAPAAYLRRLPAPLAATCLTHGLTATPEDTASKLLLHQNGHLIARCLTSDKYSRIWNDDIIAHLLVLADEGWRVPPARPAMAEQPGARRATEADILDNRGGGGGLSINVGDMIAPAGLYASDHDMFAFMVNEAARINDGSEGGLSRGFFVSNSEVGAASLRVTKFLYRHVCGNHIVWGAENVSELRIIHRGAADARFVGEIEGELTAYANESASDEEAKIATCKRFVIGATKEEVLDRLFKAQVLPRVRLEAAYDYATQQADTTNSGGPHTAWGFAQGVTVLAGKAAYADERNAIDRAAGKILQMAF